MSNINSNTIICDPAIIAGSQATKEKYPVNEKEYTLKSVTGQGAYSTVYDAIINHSNERVAIKVIDMSGYENISDISKEVTIISMLKHPNIISVLVSFISNQSLWVVMPLMNGSCRNILKNHPTGIKDEKLLSTILKDVLNGLVYIHKNNYIHRDIKGDNILVGDDGVYKISDFGVSNSSIENGHKTTRTTFTGTPCWMAPEILSGNEYDAKIDIWSFGITALELAFGHAPYYSCSPMKAMLLILENKSPTADIYNDRSYNFSSNFHDMVKKCLDKNPNNRPTACQLLKHKFFNLAKPRSIFLTY